VGSQVLSSADQSNFEESEESARSGENFDLTKDLFQNQKISLAERAQLISTNSEILRSQGHLSYFREILSPADRTVIVRDPMTSVPRTVLMFGSNNYLGLANHPKIKEAVRLALDTWGAGIGGPPILNGYLSLTQELEERVSAVKEQESTILYSSGYSANLGVAVGLTTQNDRIYYDEYSHASLIDGMRMAASRGRRFRHNDAKSLQDRLERHDDVSGIGQKFVCVEGVYSMDGDLAPLDEILPVCQKHAAMLVVDDAHGLGVVGERGHGVGEHFGIASQIDVLMGSFSKTIALNGGFISTSRPLAEYLRYASRSYMFSASMPPITLAAALAGLNVIDEEPHLRLQLADNVHKVATRLNSLNHRLEANAESAIIIVRAPTDMYLRAANRFLFENGIFLNAVEYPAVPPDGQRFRISVMATHTSEDIDRLVEVIDELWHRYSTLGQFRYGN